MNKTVEETPRAQADERSAALAQTAFSCVVDQNPFHAAQCFIWANCLFDIQGVPAANLFVHHAGELNADFSDWLKSKGINLIRIKPFDARSAHCNKIQQLDTFADSGFKRVLLTDCDTAWIGGAPLPEGGPIMAKTTDNSRPPEAILEGIYREAKMGGPDWVPVTVTGDGPGWERTDRNNCNGGVYFLDRTIIPDVRAAWRKWAGWCLDHRHLFFDFGLFVDQVSFALATRELGITIMHLPPEWNYSTIWRAKRELDVTPEILHFHQHFGADFHIKPVGLAKPDQAIAKLNQRIDHFITKGLVNSAFWDVRYSVAPELGSGPGSRGEFLTAKREWLSYALGTFSDGTVVDVGCGDLEVTKSLPVKKYLGLDVSRQALTTASSKRRDWFFAHLGGDEPAIPEADVVICLDVLIHQKSPAAFESLIRRLAKAARKRLIVSGFNSPQSSNGTTAYHRPLAAALRETNEFSEMGVLGIYRDVSLIVADKRRPLPHPHDMATDQFNQALKLTKRPDLLRHLADLSRQMFTFYTAHFPRAIEYPWVAGKLETLAPGCRIIDIGSGLNPLPLFLARRGAQVDCIDSHPTKRIPPVQPGWNEWGFYDYAPLHRNLSSHHINALAFEPKEPVDVVYSVSVLEHMPRATQKELIGHCRQWLKPNGRLLLTIDLVPGTQSLWNLVEGKEVEPRDVHGDAQNLLDDLSTQGFKPMQASVHTGVPHSRTDLLFIDCIAN